MEDKDKNINQSSTPMMKQYMLLKEEYKDCLLFFRMGDFYEMFFEDAKIAAKILDISLTKRGKDKENDIAMCGVPHHSCQPYLEKLIKNGYNVAICEQLETAEESKKRGHKSIVKRDVVRIVTPGTITEENLLESNCENYLLALTIEKNKCQLSWSDISIGKFYVDEIDLDNLENYIAQIAPQEIILDDKILSLKEGEFLIKEYKNKIVNFPSSYFNVNKNKEILKDFYKTKFLDMISISDHEIKAAGALISYLGTTQKNNMPKLGFPKKIENKNYMQIDKSTMKSLEVFYTNNPDDTSLYQFINKTKTAGGARLLRSILTKPLLDIEKIKIRQNKIEFFYNNKIILEKIREIINNFPDAQRALQKLIINRGGPKDLLNINNSFNIFAHLFDYSQIYSLNNIDCNILGEFKELENITDIIDYNCSYSIRDGNFIKSGINKELDNLRKLQSSNEDIIKEIEEKYRSQTQIPNLKIKSTNILGYYIEIKPNQIDKMDINIFRHRQTLANSVRYISEELNKLQNDIISSQQKAYELEIEIYNSTIEILSQNIDKINKAINLISSIDIYSNLAYIAHKYNLSKPSVNNSLNLDIKEGFHPIVKYNNNNRIDNFINNQCNLDSSNFLWFITGPNMAGKSTFLRQNALIIILSQIGSYIPAKSAEIGIVDKIFSRVGASDDLSRGRSTFMVEMIETSTILNNATSRSFLILDEIGRGTATYDGIALAWSIVEYIHNKIRARTLFASHYHELSQLENKLNSFKCYYSKVIQENNKIIFEHKISKGIAKKSYGISVAALAGFPQEILDRANNIMSKLENNQENNTSLQMTLFDHLDNSKKILNANDNKKEEYNKLDQTKKKIYDNILQLDIDSITPKQALDILYDYKKQTK